MTLAQRLVFGYIKTKFTVLTALSKKRAAKKAFDLFCTPQTRNKKKLPKIFSNAIKLQFQLQGQTVRGWQFPSLTGNIIRRVLIVHGFESSGINFDRYIRPLTKKGYEVLVFDAPAHGRSTGKRITAPLYKATIKEIVLRYGPVESYLAHSFGGLGLSLALEEINHTKDYRVALIAPATETVTAIDGFFKFLKLDPAIRPEFEKIVIKTGGVSSEWYSIRRAMKHIRARVLWFHDDDDKITPVSDVIKVKEENYSNIEFVFTKGLGHRRIYKDNKVVKSVIGFLM